MKRGTPEHPKTEMLSMLLDVPLAQAVGHLEMLWHFAGKYAPRGDIGRWPEAMIAKRAGWSGDSAVFLSALESARGDGKHGWIEKSIEGQWVIHDWHEHADETVKKWLANHGECFWNGLEPFANRSRTFREDGAKKQRLPEPEPEPERGWAASPLAAHPMLAQAYPTLQGLLIAAHPRSKSPSPAAERDAQDTLAKLCTMDGYPEAEIVECLRWLLTDEHADATFWRGNVHSFKPLRGRKDGATKFQRIHEAWTRAKGNGRASSQSDDMPVWRDPTPAEAARLIGGEPWNS